MSTGALIAVQGYNQLQPVGVEALTGFTSAFFNVRLIVAGDRRRSPCRRLSAPEPPHRLGAMRINEEIDALEVMGIRSVAYLASTRVVAGVVVVIPLYCIAVLMAFLAARIGTTVVYGQSTGVYDHYFNTFLNPTDLIWSFLQASRDGRRRHAGAHLLRLHRHGRTGRRGRGGRSGGAHLDGRRGCRHRDDLPGRLRPVRQLQPVGVATMEPRPGEQRLHAEWWTVILLLAIVVFFFVTATLFAGTFRSYVPVTLTVGPVRAGDGNRRQGQDARRPGRPGRRSHGRSRARPALKLEIDPDQINYIPANVGAQIKATTAFGAKYRRPDLPERPQPATAGRRRGVEVEQRHHRGQHRLPEPGQPARQDRSGQTQRDADRVGRRRARPGPTDRRGHHRRSTRCCWRSTPAATRCREDWRSFKSFNDTYAAAAHRHPDHPRSPAAPPAPPSPTSAIAAGLSAAQHDWLPNSGINLLGPNVDNAGPRGQRPGADDQPAAQVQPRLYLLVAGRELDSRPRRLRRLGRQTASRPILDVALLLGNDPYQYPDNLPIVAAKGGPGGKPGCGSLPDATKNFPVRQLVTNTGWGTGLDFRPNPGLGHPCWADWFPVTRAVPQPPSIRQCLPGPAPGPDMGPGMPPYGAAWYGPGGVPLWPALAGTRLAGSRGRGCGAAVAATTRAGPGDAD